MACSMQASSVVARKRCAGLIELQQDFTLLGMSNETLHPGNRDQALAGANRADRVIAGRRVEQCATGRQLVFVAAL